jgi:hypothetical protein
VDSLFFSRVRRWVNEAQEQWATEQPWPQLLREETFSANGTRALMLPPRVKTVLWAADQTNQRPLDLMKHWDREFPDAFFGNTTGAALIVRQMGISPVSKQPGIVGRLTFNTLSSDTVAVYVAGLALDTSASGTAENLYYARETVQIVSDGTYTSTALFSRIATPVAKYYLNKRVVGHVAECMECHGSAGYVEEWPIARLYRQAPLNSIWEGSGNIMCLDVLRAIERTPNAVDVLRHELGDGKNARLKDATTRLEKRLAAPDRNDESQARALVRDLVVALQAALLTRNAPAAVSDAFCASRLSGEDGAAFGMLPRGVDFRAIADRAAPRN